MISQTQGHLGIHFMEPRVIVCSNTSTGAIAFVLGDICAPDWDSDLTYTGGSDTIWGRISECGVDYQGHGPVYACAEDIAADAEGRVYVMGNGIGVNTATVAAPFRDKFLCMPVNSSQQLQVQTATALTGERIVALPHEAGSAGVLDAWFDGWNGIAAI